MILATKIGMWWFRCTSKSIDSESELFGASQIRMFILVRLDMNLLQSLDVSYVGAHYHSRNFNHESKISNVLVARNS